MESEKTITARWLDKHDACRNGVNWFVSKFPDGALISEVLVGLSCDSKADSGWFSWLISRAKHTDISWVTKLPESIGGSLDLSGCKNRKKLKIPTKFKGKVRE